jgi:uncharacterized membrane protein YkoI
MRGLIGTILIAIAVAASVVPSLAAPRADATRTERVRNDDGVFAVADRGRGRGDHDRARDGVNQGRLLPLEAVLSRIARQIPGHHLDVDGPFQRGGRWIYRIKWLTPDGRVLIIFADAETGQILETRGG